MSRKKLAQFVAAAGAGVLLSSSAMGALIGVNFVGGDTTNGTLAASAVAGAPGVTQANFNNVTGGTGTALPLVDNAGAATTATLTFTAGGVFTSTGNTPAGPDETLFKGFIFGNSTITVNNIPASALGAGGRFNLIVYGLNDAIRTDQITIGSGATNGDSHFVNSPAGGTAGYVDGSATTPFTYLLSQGLSSAAATPNSDYTLFAGLLPTTGGGLTNGVTFSVQAPGNGFLSGFQIVPSTAVPEPAAAGLLGLAAMGLLARRRRS